MYIFYNACANVFTYIQIFVSVCVRNVHNHLCTYIYIYIQSRRSFQREILTSVAQCTPSSCQLKRFTLMCLYLCIYIYERLAIYLYIYTFAFLVYIYRVLNICVHIIKSTYGYIYIYIYLFQLMFLDLFDIYIYIYTHTTQLQV